MNVQEAIDLAVKEDRRVTFECHDDREAIITSVVDRKGCALMKDSRDGIEVTAWPPSQCTVLHDQGRTRILPKVFA